MTDTFNLVPGTNEEKFLDNILRAAQGEQPQYDLAPNWRIEQYLAAIAAKLSGSALPPITAADDGKVLTANSGVWGAQNPIGKPFIVTLTPTSEDFSGTMDKTVAEINEAYLSGQKIVFYISAVGMNVEFPLVDANKSDDYDYPSFDAVLWNVIDNVFMHVSTSFTDNGDKDTYAVYTFPMTYDSANGVSF